MFVVGIDYLAGKKRKEKRNEGILIIWRGKKRKKSDVEIKVNKLA